MDKITWDLVPVSFGEQGYLSHQLVYGSELIRCGFCGHPVTGEEKAKPTNTGPKTSIYYRCARYQRPVYPRIRLREAEIDTQLEAIMDDRLSKTISEEKYVAKQHELAERETLLRRRVEINRPSVLRPGN